MNSIIIKISAECKTSNNNSKIRYTIKGLLIQWELRLRLKVSKTDIKTSVLCKIQI